MTVAMHTCSMHTCSNLATNSVERE